MVRNIFLIFSILVSTICLGEEMDKFLSMREELYHLRHGGLEKVPLLTIFGKDSEENNFNENLSNSRLLLSRAKSIQKIARE